MYRIIIQWFFDFLCSFYLYQKLLNLKKPSLFQKISLIGFFVMQSFILCFLEEYITYMTLPLFIIVNIIFLKIVTPHKINLIFPTFVISYAFSYVSLTIAAFLLTLTLMPFFYEQYNLPYSLIQFSVGILQFLLVHLPFRLRRLKKGMPFLYRLETSYIGTLIACLILLTNTLMLSDIYSSNIIFAFLSLALLFLGLILFFWWRSRITADYRMKLRQAELLTLKKELAEKNEQIAELEANNDALAKIIHKDNKLIPAMEMAVCEYLDSGLHSTSEELAKKSEQLTTQLKSMSHDRRGILNEYRKCGHTLPSSGVCVLDALFSYMQKKAEDSHIDFSLYLEGDLTSMTENIISGDDLSHVLSDLIENAMIAARTCNVSETITDSSTTTAPGDSIFSPAVSVYLCYTPKHCTLEVSDNGAPFDVQLFQDMGQTQRTTHEASGGSGIGLMDLWKLKKRYRASLHIYEYRPENNPFSKKIALVFDKKNHYIIQSYRKSEIDRIRLRGDLFVLQDD